MSIGPLPGKRHRCGWTATRSPPGQFHSIGSSGFVGAQVPVGPGAHTVTSPVAVGALVYGFGEYVSCGYPGSMALTPRANASQSLGNPVRSLNR